MVYLLAKICVEHDQAHFVIPVRIFNKFETIFCYKEGAAFNPVEGQISVIKEGSTHYIYTGRRKFCILPEVETMLYKALISLNPTESEIKCPAGDVFVQNSFTSDMALIEFKSKLDPLKQIPKIASDLPIHYYIKSSKHFIVDGVETPYSQVISSAGGPDLAAKRVYNHLMRAKLINQPAMLEFNREVVVHNVRLAFLGKLNFIFR